MFVLATACLFNHTHRCALAVINASVILKVTVSNYKVLALSLSCCAPSLPASCELPSLVASHLKLDKMLYPVKHMAQWLRAAIADQAQLRSSSVRKMFSDRSLKKT